MRSKKWFMPLFCAVVVTLAGCASGVSRQEGPRNFQYQGQKFSKVNVTLSPSVQEILKDSTKFDPQQLASKVQLALTGRGMFDANASNTVDVEVTDIRIRNTITAVMFGFMAGRDTLQGTVKLKQSSGVPVYSFDVSASWALGGYAGGQDGARVGWLIEEFAKLTAKEIVG